MVKLTDQIGTSISDLSENIFDPSIIFSQKRHIPYYKDESRTRPEVVFEAIITVRRNDITFDYKSPEDYFNKLYLTVSERISFWLELAIDFYEGNIVDRIEKNDFTPWEETVPPRIGAANITVWGNIVNKSGTFITLTITEMTDKKMAYVETVYHSALYNQIAELSGTNLDEFGESEYRKTTVEYQVPQPIIKTNKTYGNKANNTASVSADTTVSVPSREIVDCQWVYQVKELDNFTRFRLEVGKVYRGWSSHYNEDKLTFYGYSEGLNGRHLESSDGIYVFEKKPWYPGLVRQLKEKGVLPLEKTEVTFLQPVYIVATKMFGKSNAYYDDVVLEFS